MAKLGVRQSEQEGEPVGTPALAGTSRSVRWRAVLARVLDPYPTLEAAPSGRWPRIALGLVALMALAYTVFFTAYLWAQHDAFLTHAEDLGIMDQALWNTTHGAILHQTICNVITDTNCLGDVSRLAIHFEPIMFPLALIYAVVPSPKTLQLVQTAVVACGAFPAFWIANRRLRSPLAGVVFAAVFLLYPALQAAVTYDFHAVTLAAAFLMFALYFMLARNNWGLVIACVLALATKEEIVVDVALIGLSVALLQRRWRLGFGLVGLSALWLAVELVVMHAASPLGYSPTASRYAYLGHGPVQAAVTILTHPVQILREHVFDAAGVYYLRSLLSPSGYLALLSPLTLVIAVPALAINLLSSSAAMRSGLYQYNADIVPILVFAAIEGVALAAGVARIAADRFGPSVRTALPLDRWTPRLPARVRGLTTARAVVLALTLMALFFSLHEQRGHGYLPVAHGFTWPQQTAHTRIADEIAQLIPPNASVSAQTSLVPHVSHRRYIYQFPYEVYQSDYVFLDVTGDFYPFLTPASFAANVRVVLRSRAFHVVAARDGYLLLAKGSVPIGSATDPGSLPPAFYSFAQLAPGQTVAHPLDIHYGDSLILAGYDVSPTTSPDATSYVKITLYWRVTQQIAYIAAPQLVLFSADGSHQAYNDFASVQWQPMGRWQPGEVHVIQTWPIFLRASDAGKLRLGMRVLATGDSGYAHPLPVTSALPAGASPMDDGTGAIFTTLTVKS